MPFLGDLLHLRSDLLGDAPSKSGAGGVSHTRVEHFEPVELKEVEEDDLIAAGPPIKEAEEPRDDCSWGSKGKLTHI